MPNTIPAAAEGMPAISRRTAIALMAAVSVPPTAAVAVAAVHPVAMPNALQELLDRHAAALAADYAAWEVVCDIDDMPEMDVCRQPKVQIARTRIGRDDDGNDISRPEHAHSEEQILKTANNHMEAQLAMYTGASEKANPIREKIKAGYAKRLETLLADFRAQVAERQRIHDETGYTAAEETAKAATDAVKALEKQIIDYVPETLSDAALKATWIVSAYEKEQGYIYEEHVVSALAAIGRALA